MPLRKLRVVRAIRRLEWVSEWNHFKSDGNEWQIVAGGVEKGPL